MDQPFDVAIIGGGINGCACAADAALRGLSVFLCEQNDIASKTSSSSSKLIHGGLRYLEYFDFKLVKKALDERQQLLSLAPHLVHPIPFVLPYQTQNRPFWVLRAGLFIYDHLSGKNKLPRSHILHRQQHADLFDPLNHSFQKGFLYYDGVTDDARLTVCNALQARRHGASIMTHTELIAARVDKQWELTLRRQDHSVFKIQAKTVVNATGPWVSTVSELLQTPNPYPMTLVKGSHIVVPSLYEGDHGYVLQHTDRRIVFVLPFHHATLIGTTDVGFSGHLDIVQIEQEEIDYLLEIVNQYFKHKCSQKDILTTWSGVRPLLAAKGKSLKAISRDYLTSYSPQPAPLVTVYGGKITTYRQLALQAINHLKSVFPQLSTSRTDQITLPGGALEERSLEQYITDALKTYPWMPPKLLARYLQQYGTITEKILARCHTVEDLGIQFSSLLYQVEVDYLVNEEWAQSAEDILWRRTKLGLSLTANEIQHLNQYLLY